MRKKLTRTGNSVALVLDKALLEGTGLKAGSVVEVTRSGKAIVISPPVKKARAEKFKAILEDLHREYGGVFRKLAE